MIVIQINTRSYGEKLIFIDGEDFDKVKEYKWWLSKKGNNFYARALINGKLIFLHRLLLNHPKGIVDHKNNNGLDNRRENIRECTRIENGRNMQKHTGIKSSIYKGVYFCKNRNKYKASIMDNGKVIRLGSFNNEDDAGEAYNKKATELFGEFANLNLIQREVLC